MSGLQVFISYAHEDSVSAQRLYNDLKNAGLNPWLDKESILPGHKWESELKEAMRKSRYFIPILSRNSALNKGYVQKEIKAALDVLEEVQKSDVYVIPVRIDEIEIDDKKFRGLHIVDLFPDWNHGVKAVLKSIESGAASLSAPTKHGMRAAQIGLGIIAVILSISVLTTQWQLSLDADLIIIISIALLIIGIERIISGIFSPGKGRRAILALGFVVLTVSIMTLTLPMGSIFALLTLAIALLIDSIARVYFGIANKTTSRWSRIFSIVAGIMETIVSILILVAPFVTVLFILASLGIALMIVSIQMMAAGIAGRRLTIAR